MLSFLARPHWAFSHCGILVRGGYYSHLVEGNRFVDSTDQKSVIKIFNITITGSILRNTINGC